jgi:tRNA uridine 5-carboxymethylaminomethyl modification enzyme
MVDDLVLQGVTEPYRMLTARAEFRLRLRADNAAARLTPKAVTAGCASEARRLHYEAACATRAGLETLLSESFSGKALNEAGVAVRDDGVRRSLADWLRFPELAAAGLARLAPAIAEVPAVLLEEAIQDHRYAPYVARQANEIARLRSDDAVQIPADLDFGSVPGLSNEMVERLSLARPSTLGAAARIRGITPTALAAILVHSRRKAA